MSGGQKVETSYNAWNAGGWGWAGGMTTITPNQNVIGTLIVDLYGAKQKQLVWRGTNENTNLLLRQYFPRGTDLSVHSQAHLDQIALRLNQRPRKTLGLETPASKLQTSVASTV